MKSESLLLKKSQLKEGAKITLPPSKSESNRYLMINALSGSISTLLNLSSSRDTLIFQRALTNSGTTIDVEDAGTAMRFLTAYFAVTGKRKILKGSERMHKRPIGDLVEAFKKLGADIKYLGSKGFPPIEIADFVHSGKNKVQISGGISSQFISALMMIGPKLDGGLTITLAGKVVSKPYILLTSSLMGQFGIKPIVKASSIFIKEGKYRKRKVKVDGDWSAASYWYSLFRLSNAKRILLTGLSHHPRQGDAKLISIMKGFGVRSRPIPGGYELTRIKFRQRKIFDFIENPDLAQTIIVLCALLKVRAKFNGLDTLSIKETDRIKAIQKELSKIGVAFLKNQDNSYSLSFLTISGELPKQIRIRTYEDHRMAMAFAPLMLFTDVLIENPSVINKSYPGFWNQLESVMEFAN